MFLANTWSISAQELNERIRLYRTLETSRDDLLLKKSDTDMSYLTMKRERDEKDIALVRLSKEKQMLASQFNSCFWSSGNGVLNIWCKCVPFITDEVVSLKDKVKEACDAKNELEKQRMLLQVERHEKEVSHSSFTRFSSFTV